MRRTKLRLVTAVDEDVALVPFHERLLSEDESCVDTAVRRAVSPEDGGLPPDDAA